ncbi:amino acid ABC transporter permease [Salinarimonas ramus]|uniref:Amino acid ABC transporter permease n=1 Tax=Salinarimonas ramus TaxID=690164 RepID=A0A917QK87_9HYPH|nr:amino acid ABC transporter permease [Salinarimonas ramus]
MIYDPKVRGFFFQGVLVLVIGWLAYEAVTNAIENLRAARIASGFGFFGEAAGFDINQAFIPYSSASSTYFDAFMVGLLNTLVVAAIGIVLATIIGFAAGIARLSKNFILAKVAATYVELIRNLPLLLQLLFWYNAVLATLPAARDAIPLGPGIYLSVRGLSMPAPIYHWDAFVIPLAFAIGLVASIVIRRWAKARQAATGEQFPVGWTTFGLLVGLPALVWGVLALFGANPISFDVPEQGRFNLTGGMQLYPEFVALVLGLSVYTGAFIAEVVRAGILAVSRGQTEAASSLGLKPGQTMRFVVIPQAMRVIVPPLTSQYLNLTKNSSLAVAIAYPDLVQVFMGTVLNQTGQAVEVVTITMLVYLTISLVTSFFMNMYNQRIALVER